MLSSDEIALLTWFSKQLTAQSLAQLEEINPPAFSRRRISDLKKEGFLSQELGFEDSEIIAKYHISDKGNALLERLEEDRQERAQERADKRAERYISIFSAIIGAVAGSALTLIVEHFGEFIDLMQSLFG